MRRLPTVSSKDVLAAPKKAGFLYAPKRGKGSHVALVKHSSGGTRLVIVPKRKAIPSGTLRAILEQAGLSRDDFLALIK